MKHGVCMNGGETLWKHGNRLNVLHPKDQIKMIRKGEGDILDKVNKLVKVLFANGNQAMGTEIGKWKPGYGK